jgi:hypothetical protein
MLTAVADGPSGRKRPLMMSALPPKADISSAFYDVRFVPTADMAPGVVLRKLSVVGRWQSVAAICERVSRAAIHQLQYGAWLVPDDFTDYHCELAGGTGSAVGRTGRWRLRSRIQNRRSAGKCVTPSLLQCNKPDRGTKLAIARPTLVAVSREIANGPWWAECVAPRATKISTGVGHPKFGEKS